MVNEVFPLAAGMMLGFVVCGAPAAQRRLLLAVLGLLFGLLASLISGELRLSWSFWMLDSLFVICAAEAVGTVLRTSILRY
jgi:hypothetical protein